MKLNTAPAEFRKLFLIRVDCLDREAIPELLGELDSLVRRQMTEVKESRCHTRNIAESDGGGNFDHVSP